MATTDATVAPTTDADTLAGSCRDAEFLTIYAAATGDGLAAAATLAAVRAALDRPYQISLVRTPADREARQAAADEATTAVELDGTRHASQLAYDVADRLADDPDPVPALAGLVAAGDDPATDAPELVETAAIERQPGLAVPTTDPVDGLVHTTLAHSEFSGDRAATEAAIEALEEPDARELASEFVLAVVSDDAITDRAAQAVERAIRPYALDGPIPTLGGFADVLSALARTAPGLGLALVRHDHEADEALDAWRTRAVAVHEAVREATHQRYDGLVVSRTDGPVEPVARLLRDFRAPERTVLAIGEGEAAIAGTDDSTGQTLVEASATIGASARDDGHRGYARYPTEQTDALVDAVREAV